MSNNKPAKQRKGRSEYDLDSPMVDPCYSRAISNTQDASLEALLSVASELNELVPSKLVPKKSKELEEKLLLIRPKVNNFLQFELNILMAKIRFLRNDWTKAISMLQQMDYKRCEVSVYAYRRVKLLAEAYAIHGLSIVSSMGEGSIREAPEQLSTSLDLCITHLQDLERLDNEPEAQLTAFPKVIEMAINKEISILMNNRNLHMAVNRLRAILRYEETRFTRGLRQSLSRMLAELLLRGMSRSEYRPCSNREVATTFKRPKTYPTSNRVLPLEPLQESLVLLLISEYIANQDVILNRNDETRNKTNHESVYDLLVLNIIRSSSYEFLARTLEKSLRFSFEEFHIWYQYALSLIGAREYYRAYMVLGECQRIQPNKIGPVLLASSLCFGHLQLLNEGTELVSKAIDLASDRKEFHLLARAHLIRGWGYCLIAQSTRLLSQKQELQWQAISEYRTATQLNPHDYLSWYHLSLELGNQRKIDEALIACQQSLALNPVAAPVLRLLALIHTASHNAATETSAHCSSAKPDGQLDDLQTVIGSASTDQNESHNVAGVAHHCKQRLDLAAQALQAGLAENPHDLGLLFTKAKVELLRVGPEGALSVYRQIVELWRDTFNYNRTNQLTTNSSETDDVGDPLMGDGEGVFPLGNVLQGFTNPNRIELIMSEMINGLSSDNRLESYLLPPSAQPSAGDPMSPASSHRNRFTLIFPSSSSSRSVTNNNLTLAQFVRIRLYTALAEFYLDQRMLKEARQCLAEVTTISHVNHPLLYLRGRALELEGRLPEAKAAYDSALALETGHLKSLLALGRLLHDSGEFSLAERLLRQAISVEPTSSLAWRTLGDVLMQLNQPETLSETFGVTDEGNCPSLASAMAYQKAMELEQTEPIEPFYVLPLGVSCL